MPIGPPEGPQDLILFEKRSDGQIVSHSICQVQYMALVIVEKGEGSCS